jgi:hypothetical protein
VALAALRSAGWPDRVDAIDAAAVTRELCETYGLPDAVAAHAFTAALAQLMAERFKSSAYIDVDLCTAHLLVVRQRDQVRHYSIDYVLTTLAAVHGPAFPPDDNNNLH